MSTDLTKGGFTIPGEEGQEELTLRLAQMWGADCIRDSDGTKLPESIINSGYDIYSTICVIRDHNEWAKKNTDKLQQTFLMTPPVTATCEKVEIDLMESFFAEQFMINESDESRKLWQVFDRTCGEQVETFTYENGKVTVTGAVPYHRYTVNFLAYRIWEEISMYNHTTNSWDKEHLMQIDPIHPETQEYMLSWMDDWCKSHPATKVVRFTSMFYNFVWIWGANSRNRHLFTDWASYDFTVSPLALSLFEKKYGYALTSEDFINGGKLHATHLTCDKKKLDYMEFVNNFVIEFGKKLIDIVHAHGKVAYVFYDDSWVGVEPWGERFSEFGFDGLIKCVFNAFETRLCAGVDSVATHEIRLHPYLFPVGLGGAPTFMEGGDPTADAKGYWKNVRRGLLRNKIDRIGLGGYLSLTIPFPDFNDYIAKIADEFRLIRQFHTKGKPYVLSPRVAVLTFWGKLRSWTCSGHYHEHPDVDLINIIESLAGLPFDVEFISFEDVKNGKAENYDVIINAGVANSAWSGYEKWADADTVTKLTKWVHDGGVFIGVNQPSAYDGADTYFRMAHVLGIDEDTGDRICHGRYSYDIENCKCRVDGALIGANKNVYITDEYTRVIAEKDGAPALTAHPFGKGKGIYMGGYTHNEYGARTLMNLIINCTGGDTGTQKYITDNPLCECAYYPAVGKLVIINNSDKAQSTTVKTDSGDKTAVLDAFDIKILDL